MWNGLIFICTPRPLITHTHTNTHTYNCQCTLYQFLVMSITDAPFNLSPWQQQMMLAVTSVLVVRQQSRRTHIHISVRNLFQIMCLSSLITFPGILKDILIVWVLHSKKKKKIFNIFPMSWLCNEDKSKTSINVLTVIEEEELYVSYHLITNSTVFSTAFMSVVTPRFYLW